MKVVIYNIKEGITHENPRLFETNKVSVDPENRYAVVEVQNGLFVAIKITSSKDGLLTGEYVDHYWAYDSDIPILQKYTVSWENITNGFCKLVLWAPEKVNKFGGSFEKTVKRFYFDWERYKHRYEELNGVQCPKNDPLSEEKRIFGNRDLIHQ